jgi:hypothetical protein
MDLTSKLSWVLQTGKMSPTGMLGQVMSNYVLEESFFKDFGINTFNQRNIFFVLRRTLHQREIYSIWVQINIHVC